MHDIIGLELNIWGIKDKLEMLILMETYEYHTCFLSGKKKKIWGSMYEIWKIMCIVLIACPNCVFF